jgi:hypothetical protein
LKVKEKTPNRKNEREHASTSAPNSAQRPQSQVTKKTLQGKEDSGFGITQLSDLASLQSRAPKLILQRTSCGARSADIC